MPLQGCVDEISRVRVTGWATDPEHPDAAVKIVVLVDGNEVARGSADRFREGLKEYLGGDATGFYQFNIDFPKPLSAFLPYEIQVVADGFEEQLKDWKRTISSPRLPDGNFRPLIITSTGRSGTTYLMRALHRHPKIVVADRYPYEIKLIAYYSAAYQALVSNEDRVNSTTPDEMFGKIPGSQVGHNPYNVHGLYSIIRHSDKMLELFEGTIPLRFAEIFHENIKDYYNLVREDQSKPSAIYFAEKGDLDESARLGARLFFGAVREVVVLRDPRDMLCSAKAFWGQTSKQAIKKLTETLPRLEEIRKTAGADTIFVRYEDIILDPSHFWATLACFVGLEDLELDDPSASTDTMFASHATSSNPLASIDRWKKDLTTSEIRDCERLFGSYMDIFGYPRTKPLAHSVHPLQIFQGDLAVERERSEGLGDGGLDLRVVFKAGFQRGNESERYLGSGWYNIEQDFVWTQGFHNSLHLKRPMEKGQYLLRLIGRPLIVQPKITTQRVIVFVNSEFVGEAALNNFSVLECNLPWDLISGNEEITIDLRCLNAARPCDIDPAKPDDRVLGFALEQALILAVLPVERSDDHSPTEASADFNQPAGGLPDALSLPELMGQFESLGENCEFGLVQRRCGIDPLGLFRFSSTPLPNLIRALNAKFDAMGAPNNLEIQESSNGREYMVLDRCFGFLYHAWILVGEKTPEQVLSRELRRLPLLVRKLVEDLQLGGKIFIFHGMEPLSLDQALELSEAVGAYGPGNLLWVERSDDRHAPGFVERFGPGLLKGYIDRFAPGEDAHDLSLDCWIDICRNAYALVKSEA